ncbi:hypothetical protein JCM10207_007399 [Rhodosporidiobolus poonsookiae]
MDAPLADPSTMTPQQRTDELVKAVREDDLLGVVLFLRYSRGDEVNGTDRKSGQLSLEVALIAPFRSLAVRQLVTECLLHSGAKLDSLPFGVRRLANEQIDRLLQDWTRGGREQGEFFSVFQLAE